MEWIDTAYRAKAAPDLKQHMHYILLLEKWIFFPVFYPFVKKAC